MTSFQVLLRYFLGILGGLFIYPENGPGNLPGDPGNVYPLYPFLQTYAYLKKQSISKLQLHNIQESDWELPVSER